MLGREPVIDGKCPRAGGPRDAGDKLAVGGQRTDDVAPAVEVEDDSARVSARHVRPLARHAVRLDRSALHVRWEGIHGKHGVEPGALFGHASARRRYRLGLEEFEDGLEFWACHTGPPKKGCPP